MIASMIDGVPKMNDCERLLVLCIHLKDTSNCCKSGTAHISSNFVSMGNSLLTNKLSKIALLTDPLRVLAINICFEILEQQLLPISSRKSILRFVLGPADFIMHHLEWRISLLERVNQLVNQYVTFT